jgi:uncharacterized protein (UPF0147 family)
MISNDFIDLETLPQLVQKTTQLLEAAVDELLLIRWTDSEANTDSEYSSLACQKFQEAFALFDYKNIIVEEINPPDIQITFKLIKDDMTSEIIKRKIELKSCKGSTLIPGSTIKKLDFNSWVIFCRRSSSNSKFDFRYGRYYLGINITQEDRFQDRTPRPHLNWNKYQISTDAPILDKITNDKEWIKRYARAAINRVQANKKSWQDDLVREIIRIAILEDISLND